MCEDASEFFDVQSSERVKARKAHVCCACSETIKPGHYYIRTFTVFEGAAESYKHCLRCDKMLEELFRVVDGHVAVAFELNCGELWENNFGPVPDHVARLAFLTQEEAQVVLTDVPSIPVAQQAQSAT